MVFVKASEPEEEQPSEEQEEEPRETVGVGADVVGFDIPGAGTTSRGQAPAGGDASRGQASAGAWSNYRPSAPPRRAVSEGRARGRRTYGRAAWVRGMRSKVRGVSRTTPRCPLAPGLTRR